MSKAFTAETRRRWGNSHTQKTVTMGLLILMSQYWPD